MSGNPFRRAKGDRIPENDGAGGVNATTQPFSLNPLRTKKPKKVVKIQTPPHSPEEVHRRLSAGRVSPPPPPTTIEDDVEESDSTATADSDLEQAIRNTRRNSRSMEPTPVGFTARAGTGAPANPFSRTLATSEASFGLQRGEEVQNGVSGKGLDQRSNGGRPAMNVDQFKNILLTGSASPSPQSGLFPGAGNQTRKFEDGNDKATSSTTATFEPYLDVQEDTPRTSLDQLDYPSDSSDSPDEENSGLMTGTVRLDDFAPPAPPKHSHGRPDAPKGPQTVSFADFDETIPEGSRPRASPVMSDGPARRPPGLHRTASDLNKPLPLPPQEPTTPRNIVPEEPDVVPPSPQQETAFSNDALLEAKKPPPPPVSRRAGQQTPTQSRITNPAANPTSSQPDTLSITRRPSDDSASKAAPPPPPSRKAKQSTPSSTTTTTTSLEPPSPTPSTATPNSASTETKQMPPPPPRRMASKAGNSVHRSPSNASARSGTTGVQRREGSGSGVTPAPAPPPPRRGPGAKRESTEVSSAPLKQGENELPVPLHGRTERTGMADATETRDVLADLTAFQAEIDALRKRAEDGAG